MNNNNFIKTYNYQLFFIALGFKFYMVQEFIWTQFMFTKTKINKLPKPVNYYME